VKRRDILAVSLAAIFPLVRAAAQSAPPVTAGPNHILATPSSLPDAPAPVSVEPVAASEQPVRLPSSFRPAWSADRSRLGDKLSYGFASLGSVRNLVEGVAIAGIPNLPSAPHQPVLAPGETADQYQVAMDLYGDAMNSWEDQADTIMRYHARRLEDGLATAETRDVLANLVLPIALRQQARYRPAPIDASFSERMSNAAASILVTNDDHGRVVPNYSRLIGTFAAAYMGSHVYPKLVGAPELDSNRFMLKYAGYSFAGDLAENIAHEMLRVAVEPDMEVYRLHGRSTEDSYYPLSAGAKVIYWAHSTYSSRAFVQALLTASLFTIPKQPVQPPYTANSTVYDAEYSAYGDAIEYWRRNLENTIRYHERRFFGGLATAETQVTVQNLAIPMLFGVDPRYIPLGNGYDAGTRLAHTFQSLVIARTDSGGRTINFPLLVGTIGSAVLAKEVYFPQLGTPALASNGVMARTISLNLAADLVGNITSEFFHHRGY